MICGSTRMRVSASASGKHKINDFWIWLFVTEVESRTQGSRPRPRQGHKKNPRSRLRPKTALSRTDPLEAKDRNAWGQGQGPRTQAQVFSKKRSSKDFFRRSQEKKKSSKIFFQAFSSKTRLLKSTIQEKCWPRAEDRPTFKDLRPRGQGQGLDLRGQGLQTVSSTPRTSSRTPSLITELPNFSWSWI